MIWEYNCRAIVMLTKCVEAGRLKCDQYWPSDYEPVFYGDLQVTVVNLDFSCHSWTIRELEISKVSISPAKLSLTVSILFELFQLRLK